MQEPLDVMMIDNATCSRCEFAALGGPDPRRGLTSVEAAAFLHAQFPDQANWTAWSPPSEVLRLTARMVGPGLRPGGEFGGWNWRRVGSSYPELAYWRGSAQGKRQVPAWVGLLELQSPGGETFRMFSYLTSMGRTGATLFVSTTDLSLLGQFERALLRAFDRQRRPMIRVKVIGGSDVYLPAEDDEAIFLCGQMQSDIEQQADAFFGDPALYRTLKLAYRRGFLFVGEPGNGKSMMIRRLIRRGVQRYSASVTMLKVSRMTDETDLAVLFDHAAAHSPGLVIIEDIDSLACETQVTRASLLAQLDGLTSRKGLLVIGSTNDPAKVDPALAHRPSRFDRVWQFSMPDRELRRRYLGWSFPMLAAEFLDQLARTTEGWSFAYLSELRVSARVLAAQTPGRVVTNNVVRRALDCLGEQFRAGQKNHLTGEKADVGFGIAP